MISPAKILLTCENIAGESDKLEGLLGQNRFFHVFWDTSRRECLSLIYGTSTCHYLATFAI